MEEEMIALHNIMPVDLALRRELEYRKKMEISKNQHQNDLKPLALLQVPVSGSEMVGERKRKVQPSNARFVCVICRVAFATVFHLKMHGVTFAHRAKVCTAREKGENVSNPFVCELCDIKCSSGRVMEFHVAGLKHAECLEDAKRARICGILGSVP